MRNYSRYLLFNAYAKGSKQIIIYHDPNPEEFAVNPQYGMNYDNTTIFYANSLQEFRHKFEEEYFYLLSFDSNEELNSIKIYYQGYNDEQYSREFSNYFVCDYFQKKNNSYNYYFSLKLYTDNNLKYKVILFKPQNGLNDTSFSLTKIKMFPQKVPLYGELYFKGFNSYYYYRYYFNIDSFEVGDEIYLQFIIKDYDYENYENPIISYSFSDENFEENYENLQHRAKTKYVKTKDNKSTYNLVIKVEEKAKYLLFVCINTLPNILIKHIKTDDESEQDNTTLFVIIITVAVLLLLVGVVAVIFFIKRRKRMNNSDIENISKSF